MPISRQEAIAELTKRGLIPQEAANQQMQQQDPFKKQINQGFGIPGGRNASALFSGLATPGENIASFFTGGKAPKAAGYFMPENPSSGENIANLLGQSAILGPAAKAGGSLLKGALSIPKLFPSQLSPQELSQNLEVSRGTPTDLGNIIGNPGFKKMYENYLGKAPFGAQEELLEAGQNIAGRGQDILGNLLGNESPYNAPKQVNEDLTGAFKEAEKSKTFHYDDANELADKINLSLKFPNFSEISSGEINQLSNNPLIASDPKLLGLLNKIKGYQSSLKEPAGPQYEESFSSVLGPNAQPISMGERLAKRAEPPLTLKDVNMFKGKLNEIASTLRSFPDAQSRYEAGLMSQLAGALKKDIQSSIESSGSEKLLKSYNKAETNYGENYGPFLDPDVWKFAKGLKDSDTIVQSFLKTSNLSDRANQLAKITDKLSQKGKNLFAYEYFSSALDGAKLNAGRMNTLIKKLGERQLEELISNTKIRKALNDFTRAYQLNKASTEMYLNPLTGQQGVMLDVLKALATGGGAVAGAMGGGLPGAIIGAGATAGAVKGATKFLTNEKIREAVVKALIKHKQKEQKLNEEFQKDLAAQILKQGRKGK